MRSGSWTNVGWICIVSQRLLQVVSGTQGWKEFTVLQWEQIGGGIYTLYGVNNTGGGGGSYVPKHPVIHNWSDLTPVFKLYGCKVIFFFLHHVTHKNQGCRYLTSFHIKETCAGLFHSQTTRNKIRKAFTFYSKMSHLILLNYSIYQTNWI